MGQSLPAANPCYREVAPDGAMRGTWLGSRVPILLQSGPIFFSSPLFFLLCGYLFTLCPFSSGLSG